MNAIKSLPLGFRQQSRPSSPMPTGEDGSHNTTTAGGGAVGMVKTPSGGGKPGGRSVSNQPSGLSSGVTSSTTNVTATGTTSIPNNNLNKNSNGSMGPPQNLPPSPIIHFNDTSTLPLTRPKSQPAQSRSRSLSRPLVNGLSVLSLGAGQGHAPSTSTSTANANGNMEAGAGASGGDGVSGSGREKSQPLLHRAVTGVVGRSISAAPSRVGTPIQPTTSSPLTDTFPSSTNASPLLPSAPGFTTPGVNASSTITSTPAPPTGTLTPQTTGSGLGLGSLAPAGTVGSGSGEGAHIDAIGLRLNELVNKACLGVDFKLRKGMRRGVGWSLGEGVVKELPPPNADTYLLRAVIRTSVKSLSIFVSRLEYLLLPAFTDPTFSAPLNLGHLPAATAAGGILNPAQFFSVGICHGAWEACEALEVALETQTYPRFVAEVLRPVMDKLDSLVARVVTPLMASIKKELVSSLDIGAQGSPPFQSGRSLPPTAAIALPSSATATPLSVPSKAVNSIPHCLRAFAAKVDGARKVFELICKECKDDGESWVTSVVVAVVWKGLCMVTTKAMIDSKVNNGMPPSPEAMHKAIAHLAKEGSVPSAVSHSSAGASAVSKISSILPSRSASRPPSPPRKSMDQAGGPLPLAAATLASFEALIYRLVFGLVAKPTVPTNEADATDNLAREALAEAEEAIMSLKVFVGAIDLGPKLMHDVMLAIRDDVEMPTAKEEAISDAAEDAPAILLFSYLALRANAALGLIMDKEFMIRTPAQVWGITEEDYERQFLSGFGVAEERARRVAFTYKTEVERIAGHLFALKGGEAAELKRAAGGWLRAMALALDARAGVKCTVETRLAGLFV